MTSLKLLAGAPMHELTLTLNPNFCCTNDVPFAAGNKHTANDVFTMISDVLCFERRSDSGRYADALIS